MLSFLCQALNDVIKLELIQDKSSEEIGQVKCRPHWLTVTQRMQLHSYPLCTAYMSTV